VKRKARQDRSRPARLARPKAGLNLGISAAVALAGLVVAFAVAVLNVIPRAPDEAKASVQLYRNPQCACCESYASYLRRHGYRVTTTPTHSLSLVRRQHGVPERLAGCHTTLVNGYVVEGHVPVAVLDRLLTERPNIKGISLPGMPDGSPGMTGAKTAPFQIYEIVDGPTKIYATE
jgi:hypothetical protein